MLTVVQTKDETTIASRRAEILKMQDRACNENVKAGLDGVGGGGGAEERGGRGGER
jgi:hypothetical protein